MYERSTTEEVIGSGGGEQLVVEVSRHFSSDHLPNEYAYQGSAARALALRSLEVDTAYLPRDTDLVRILEEPFPGADELYCREFMPDDFSKGYRVELVGDLDTFFRTRDFSINEIIATDSLILATEQCIEDASQGIVRLSEYEHRLYDGPGPRMVAKMLRFYSEIRYRRGSAELANTSGRENEADSTSPFWIAEQLGKAFQNGEEYAEAYVEVLIRYGHLHGPMNAAEATHYLRGCLPDDPNYFIFPINGRFSHQTVLGASVDSGSNIV